MLVSTQVVTQGQAMTSKLTAPIRSEFLFNSSRLKVTAILMGIGFKPGLHEAICLIDSFEFTLGDCVNF